MLSIFYTYVISFNPPDNLLPYVLQMKEVRPREVKKYIQVQESRISM